MIDVYVNVHMCDSEKSINAALLRKLYKVKLNCYIFREKNSFRL